jgi:hypothetical protein
MKKNLRFLFNVILLITTILVFANCDDKYARIKNYVEEENRICPINQNGVSITSFSFDEAEKMLNINALVDEDLISVERPSQETCNY